MGEAGQVGSGRNFSVGLYKLDVPMGTYRWRCQFLKATAFLENWGFFHPQDGSRKLLIYIRAPDMIRKGRELSTMEQDKNDSSGRWGHRQPVHGSFAHSREPHDCQSGAPCIPLLPWENSFLLGNKGWRDEVEQLLRKPQAVEEESFYGGINLRRSVPHQCGLGRQ